MLFLGIIGVTLMAVILIYYWIFYGTHIEMTKNDCKQWSYGSFKDFRREMNDGEWKRDPVYPKSWFDARGHDHRSKIHADIIMFNEVGMIIVPWDYPLVHFWLNHNKGSKYRSSYVKDHFKEIKG